jgi:P27 family predicted phage terminase small subunit
LSGPPPTPTHLKLLRGNPSKRPLRPGREPQPALPAEPPAAPGFLDGYALEEWNRLSGELYRLKLLTSLDLHTLAAYCDAYARWRTAKETVAAMAERDPITHGLIVKTQSGGAAPNPLVWIAAQASRDMLRFAAEFGFSPAARVRLVVPEATPGPSKFAGLLAGVRDGDDRA